VIDQESTKPKKKNSRQTAQPGAVDRYVGMKVRTRRSALRLSQEQLGSAVGLTFQQVQKYEKGINRISASRLLEISHVLEVDISYFFEGLNEEEKPRLSYAPLLGEQKELYVPAFIDQREVFDLLRAYYRIRNAQVRLHFLDLLKLFGKVQKRSCEFGS
jgi:transcriptional regulator with XRE-family HTH domain